MAYPIVTDKLTSQDDLLTRLRQYGFRHCNLWHFHMLYVSVGAAVVSNLATDYSSPITGHFLYGPFFAGVDTTWCHCCQVVDVVCRRHTVSTSSGAVSGYSKKMLYYMR